MIQLIIQGLILRPAGLFDWQTGFEQLDHSRHPLVKLNQRVNRQQFGQTLAIVRDQEPKPNADQSLLLLDSGPDHDSGFLLQPV
jgi:hypothetical protein